MIAKCQCFSEAKAEELFGMSVKRRGISEAHSLWHISHLVMFVAFSALPLIWRYQFLGGTHDAPVPEH